MNVGTEEEKKKKTPPVLWRRQQRTGEVRWRQSVGEGGLNPGPVPDPVHRKSNQSARTRTTHKHTRDGGGVRQHNTPSNHEKV